jgi:glycosyltransferase involved in cell wall biosynthesis
MAAAFRLCAIVPTFNNPQTVRNVVLAAREHVADVIVVNDGSHAEGRAACEQLAVDGLARVVHREKNGGKGAAVKSGFEAARELGFTHAFQIDADGQHALERMPEFVAVAREQPSALILGYPVYDRPAPRVRRIARRFTDFWIRLEVGGRDIIKDAMVGFRVYPLAAVARLRMRSRRMDFDIEIAVRLAWLKIPVINLPVEVRYLSAEEGGVSHFQYVRDNLRLAWLHSCLCTIKSVRFFLRLVGIGRK